MTTIAAITAAGRQELARLRAGSLESSEEALPQALTDDVLARLVAPPG